MLAHHCARCYDSNVMVSEVIQKLTALEAMAAANLFLSDHMPDRFCADDPQIDKAADVWRVPVILAYLHVGSIGEVGEIIVSANSEEILAHTPFEEMKSRGRELYEKHREAIETAFLQARNA